MVLHKRDRRHHFLLLLMILACPLSSPLSAQSFDSPNTQMFQSSPHWPALMARLSQNPQNIDVVNAIENAVENGLPNQVPTAWFAQLPVDTTTLPDQLGVQITPKAYLPTIAIEPQHGGKYTRITYFYIPTTTDGTDRLLCRIHYTTTEDAALASHMGGLLTLIHRTLVQRLGREGVDGTVPYDVWLCRNGTIGGEQWHGNIYFYDLDKPRSSIEWIREIAHEYGHLSLPPIGGYTAPEYWANGYYGERLMVRWIARTPGGPALVQQVWGDFSGWPNFERLLIDPAIALYKKLGPNAAMAARTDQTGMRYLIGQILTCDDKYGSLGLAKAFTFLPTARPAMGPDFGAAVAAMLAQEKQEADQP
jgi:hypothetical protein